MKTREDAEEQNSPGEQSGSVQICLKWTSWSLCSDDVIHLEQCTRQRECLDLSAFFSGVSNHYSFFSQFLGFR